jgi:hypothetical protein
MKPGDSGQGQVATCSERGDETLGYVKYGELFL